MGERIKFPMFETAILVLLMLLVAIAASAAWIAYSRAMVAHDAIGGLARPLALTLQAKWS